VIQISQTGDFSIFQNDGCHHLRFNFNGRKGQEGQTASPCQISIKLLLRYEDYSIFPRQDGGRPRAFGGLYHYENLVGIDAAVSIICKFSRSLYAVARPSVT